jgi:hypothetical protein
MRTMQLLCDRPCRCPAPHFTEKQARLRRPTPQAPVLTLRGGKGVRSPAARESKRGKEKSKISQLHRRTNKQTPSHLLSSALYSISIPMMIPPYYVRGGPRLYSWDALYFFTFFTSPSKKMLDSATSISCTDSLTLWSSPIGQKRGMASGQRRALFLLSALENLFLFLPNYSMFVTPSVALLLYTNTPTYRHELSHRCVY